MRVICTNKIKNQEHAEYLTNIIARSHTIKVTTVILGMRTVKTELAHGYVSYYFTERMCGGSEVG